MDQVVVIRHKYTQEEQSIRQIAREMGLNRRTVKKYLALSAPKRLEQRARSHPVLERLGPEIDALLADWHPRLMGKHRATSVRIHRQLIDAGHRIGERTVRQYMAEKRRQTAEVYIPLAHRPGDEIQVDFFEVWVDEQGVRRRVWMFVMRTMYGQRDFLHLYDRGDQISFFDGHVRGFAYFEGVARRMIYDNLAAAVKRRVGLCGRELTERFMALVCHYGFEPCFARPGEGHDKGGVESRGKGLRWQHLTPIRAGEDLTTISAAVLADVDRAWRERPHPEGRSWDALFVEDQAHYLPLPPTPFEARRMHPISISRSAIAQVEGAQYSLPERWARLDAEAWLGVTDIRFRCRGEEVLRPRKRPGGRHIVYRDYLKQLSRKPQAVRQVSPELVAELGEPYGQLWALLEKTHGAKHGAGILAGILGALHDHGESAVTEAIRAALVAGPSAPDATGILLRMTRNWPARPVLAPPLIPEALRSVQVEAGRAADYDLLLAGGVA